MRKPDKEASEAFARAEAEREPLKFKPVIGECDVCHTPLDSRKPRCEIFVVGSKLACSQRHADRLEYEAEPSAFEQADGNV